MVQTWCYERYKAILFHINVNDLDFCLKPQEYKKATTACANHLIKFVIDFDWFGLSVQACFSDEPHIHLVVSDQGRGLIDDFISRRGERKKERKEKSLLLACIWASADRFLSNF